MGRARAPRAVIVRTLPQHSRLGSAIYRLFVGMAICADAVVLFSRALAVMGAAITIQQPQTRPRLQIIEIMN
jgi:hypothetical protein